MTHSPFFSKPKIIFYNIFLWIFIGINFFVSGPLGALQTLLTLCAYGIIAFGIYSLWKKITKKDKMIPKHFMHFFFYRLSLVLIFCIVFIGGSAFYKNEVSPTPMPTYYLSNGEKEIVFQGMSHIGSEKFYKEIQTDLTHKKNNGFVYFFEGVRPGSKENQDKFNDAMGIQFDENLYKNFSKLYGVVHQDNSLYFNLVNDKDYNIDLSIDDIISYYEIPDETKRNKTVLSDDVLDANAQIIDTLSELNDKELSILRYINKAMLNFMIGSHNTRNFVLNNLANEKLFDVILNKRNELLAEEIQTTTHKKVFITYGLLHFEGVYNLLIEKDNSWEITKTENLYPITGELFPVFGR